MEEKDTINHRKRVTFGELKEGKERIPTEQRVHSRLQRSIEQRSGLREAKQSVFWESN